MSLVQRLAESEISLKEWIEDPANVDKLPLDERLDILALMQHHYELTQALVRSKHSEHSPEFMEAHADVNYWKNKLLNTKAKLRQDISMRERGQ